MITNSELVIFQAKAAISEACKGRRCLADCLRRIERAEVDKLPPAPSAAHGAKAAMRTPDALRVHPAARLRAVAGAALAAWRAFAFRARSARGRLARMLRVLPARLSAIMRPVKPAIAAAAITLGFAIPYTYGAGTCVWNGNGFVCDGSGTTVYIVGGGDGSGDVVITNIVGTCTNCVAMSPDQVRDFKSRFYDKWLELDIDANVIINQHVPNALALLEPYAQIYPVSGIQYTTDYGSAVIPVASVTNFLNTVVDTKPYQAAVSVIGISLQSPVQSAASLRQLCAAYDGAATAYNDAAYVVREATNNISYIKTSAQIVANRGWQLEQMVEGLSEEACTAQYDGPATGSGGSHVVTNQVNGDWCTYEQGQMIIFTLDSIDEWFEEQERYLKSLTNWVALVNTSIIANLNTSYGAIPPAENLGGEWRDVYLAGQRTQWGYEPTNILARIELLLYGLSGVGTNSTDVAEETGIDPNDADTAGDAASAALYDLSLDGTGPAGDFDTISDALGRFYRRFSSLTGSQFSGQQVTASYSFEIGETRYDVPSFELDDEHSRIANTAQLICRSFLVILYLLAAAYVGFRFYSVFLSFVVKYAKWAQELLSSLFAD